MSDHEIQTADAACNSDSWADAKAMIAIVVVIVTTACFWLLGR